MKTRLLSLFLATLMLLSLAACSANKGEMNDLYNAPADWRPVTPTDGEQAENIPENGIVENEFVDTAKETVSTLSSDVDTASYTYFRKLVNQGCSLSQLMGSAASFRTEEFINYFDYEVPTAKEGELFGVAAEISACPWNASTRLLRMTLKAPEAVNDKGNNLVFLIDVSGSMSSKDKLPLLKTAFSYLVESLTQKDTVSIVTYSGAEKVVLDGASGASREQILGALNALTADGSTNGESGLTRAYALAEKHFIEGGNNRIIMASDGDLNVGIRDPEALKTFVEGKRDGGVYLSILGFGTGNYRDGNMEALADHGNGVYYYIDGETEAKKIFGEDLVGTLYTVAKDVKLQVTFHPESVSAWRLIGYENRILNEEDFTDDRKDAGDVGAGHTVTVCYELKLTDTPSVTDAWLNLDVRYKNPGQEQSLLNSYTIGNAYCKDTPSEDQFFIGQVILTAMLLRKSQFLPSDVTLSTVINRFGQTSFTDPYKTEFHKLLTAILKNSNQ